MAIFLSLLRHFYLFIYLVICSVDSKYIKNGKLILDFVNG